MSQATEMPVESVLREELAHGDVVLGTIGPILGHLLANHDHSLFSDEIVARVRGMAAHVARQVLQTQAECEEHEDPVAYAQLHAEDLSAALVTSAPFLAHCHALALEWQLTHKLEQRSAIDPVLSPLLQALIASDDAGTGSTAMAALAAQARFIQQQRRMELPLGELPGDLFYHAVTTWRARAGEISDEIAGETEEKLREAYDEGASRLGLMSRLVTGMGKGARAALSVSHAGVALFLTALAMGSHQERDLAVIATNDSQLARLALGLRASGLKPDEVEEQFLQVHPDIALPDGFDMLRADKAAALLSHAAHQSGT